ncbi:MAG: SUMF1/EgtB/PvdO family nonheme iron enzyme, partial [Acidobacteriota bacterium]
LLAGRERELTKLRQLLALPIPILGFYAASGVGKSSLLLGGLVPALRQEGLPVAVVRHPREAGVAERLLGDLIDGGGAPPESLAAGATVPWRRFVDRLNEVERLAGTAPVLVLDQLEDVLHHEAGAARTALGALLAATAQRRSGIESPPCRWLLAYRQEFHGEVLAWLRDVLVDAASAGVDDLEMLPHDLSTADRFHSLPLPPLATPTPGGDALADATLLFRAAIETPLAITAPDGSPRYSWHVTHDGAARLAGAFAEARIARPEAPLTPELQVVLADLLSRADDGRIEVPEEPADLIARALEDHLRRALESAFPAAVGAAEQARVGVSRARALLALGELAEAYRARQEGLPIETLSRAIGGEDGAETGERVLARLASPLTRLIVLQEHPTGWRYVLSHDRMAEVVVRAVEAEGQRGRLSVDAEILRLRRFVALETALFRSSQQPPPRLSRHRFRRIEAHAEALLWDADRRAWFLACRERRRVDLRRAVVGSLVSAVVLVVLAYGAWSWTTAWAARRSLLEQVAQGEPEAALLALEQAHGQAIGNNELLAALRQRTVPSAVLELGLGSLAGAQRSAAVLATVELMLPLVEEAPDDPVRIANLVWALDFAPQQDPSFTARARQLRARVLAPLRRLRPPPPLPGEGDSAWVDIPGGSFLMGIADDEEGPPQERPQHRVTVSAFRLLRHEVTVGEFRRLVPDHQGDEGLPVVGVTWYQAVTYAAWLGGRLPTEAEWEYAARAGCAYAYCDRQGRETTVDAVAWTPDNARTEGGESAPRPVMGLAANPWGLYDMLGNVSEWAGDWVGLYGAEKQSDPWGPAVSAIDGSWRIHRGGGVRNEVDAGIRSTRRSRAAPDFLLEDLGLRVVLPTGPAEGSTDDH